MTDADGLAVVLSGSLIEADLVLGLLEQAGIAAFRHNEQAASFTGLGFLAPHQVAVARRDLAEALALVQAHSEDLDAAQS